MRRVYGYKRRNHACGKRYQDGINAQAKSDKAVVIDNTVLVDTAVLDGEELDLTPAAGVAKPQPAKEPTKILANPVPLKDDAQEDEIGDLPKHMTNFMDMSPQTEAEKKAQAKVFGADDEATETE
jgi:hypothetical protein